MNPIACHVEQDSSGEVILVDRFPVTEVERWRVIDRWWTEEPIEGLYVSVLLDGVGVVLAKKDGEWSMSDFS